MDVQQNVAVAQEKFIINLDANVAKIVLPVDRKELAVAYLQMFSGFAWRNWTNKYSLGRAWQTALAQCAAFTDTKNDKNPAAKYLKNVYEAHKKYWSRVIMTHDGRDNTINPNDQEIQKLRAHGERMIREAMDKINLILARYNERGEKLVGQQKQAQAQHHAAQLQPQPQPQVGAMAQQNTPQPADMMAQANAMPMSPMEQAVAQAVAQERPAVAQATKSVAQPTAQSGAFAMVRDTVKRPNAAIVDKPVEVPMAKPAEQQIEKQKPTVAKPAQMPIDIQKPTPQTIVQHAPKSVAQSVKPSGALPAIQNKAKQQNVVKTETKAEEFAKAEKRMKISAEQRVQMQIEFQKRIQMWQLGQYKQNAA